MRNRKNNNIKNIKDYIVPIVTFLIIFILIYVAFSWWDNSDNKTLTEQGTKNQSWIDIIFWTNDTKAEIINNDNKKNTIKLWDKINIWESIIVQSWNISFNIPEKADFSLNTNWKITLISNSEIELESNALWIETINNQKITTKYATINLWKKTISNIEQNEISTTVYLLKGTAEVKTINWKSIFLAPWKKISISNEDVLKDDLDLNLLKEDFDAFFKISDWFLQNNWSVYIESESLDENNDSDSWTWEIKEEKTHSNSSGLLNFDNIYDEWSVELSKTNLSWKFVDDRISQITINWKKAVVNIENKTFNLVWFDTSKKVNNLAIKIYDEEDNLLNKYLYTVYYSWWNKKDDLNVWFAKINYKPFPVDLSDFIISIPSVKNGETFSSKNTFFGTVKNPDVKSVTINGHRLRTFNWRTFRYHAYERFWTLWVWVNNYEIKYFWADGKLILKKYVTINKKSAKKIETKKISEEAKIN